MLLVNSIVFVYVSRGKFFVSYWILSASFVILKRRNFSAMEAMDIQAVESKLSDVTVTAIPMSGKNVHKDLGHGGNSHATISTVPASSPSSIGKDKDNGTSKYAQLLAVIEEMGKEVRPSYSGSRSSAERLKRGIVHARILVRECLIETERSARQ